jgi:phenylalanyl-tRNA synthetase beta chain
MDFSYNWLRELVPGLDIEPRALGHLITMKTAECEEVRQVRCRLADATSASIASVEPLAEGRKEVRLEPDWVIEIDNKSLTHRPDLWGHLGMARELAATLGKAVSDPVRLDRLPQGPPELSVSIEDHALCPRYSALVFENVTVMQSPLWLRCRLEASGLNPVNNIVDVMNYIMTELAQPMHAFGAEIIVRRAKVGESLLALNGTTYYVEPSDLVIADCKGPVSLAGVIGGPESAITEGAQRIVLESANFQAASIRRTSARLKLRTDASVRFEKSQDPENTVRALARAVTMLEEVSPGIHLAGGLADAYEARPTPTPISLSLDWLARKLGKEVPEKEIQAILESLGFLVREVEPRTLVVTPPSWRATKDISIKEDLVEEVGRIVGYSSITPKAPMVEARVPPASEERVFQRHVRAALANQGFTEVYNYSFLNEGMVRAFRLNPAELVEIVNQAAADERFLRPSLVPGIWKNILDNSRHFDEFRIFEIGREIHKRPQGSPEEKPHVTAAIYSRDGDGSESLFELKRVANCLGGLQAATGGPALFYEHP